MLEMLGIPNCDTVRKARKYLEEKEITYTFRDIRKEPLSAEEWRRLVDQDASNQLINTRSPSFRKTGVSKDELDAARKVDVLLEQPTSMKRPTLVRDDALVASGFQEAVYAGLTAD